MPKTTLSKILKKVLHTLNHVTADLINGISEEELVCRYEGQFVVPGVGIRQHLRELKAGNCLYRKEGKLFLKDSCNPLKLLGLE